MSEFSFMATANYIHDDEDIITVGFVDDPENPVCYLLMESAYHYDDQDRLLGLDKLYIELNNQSKSIYGGLKKIYIESSKLIFYFDDIAQVNLSITGELLIKLNVQLDSTQIETLQKLAKKEKVDMLLK